MPHLYSRPSRIKGGIGLKISKDILNLPPSNLLSQSNTHSGNPLPKSSSALQREPASDYIVKLSPQAEKKSFMWNTNQTAAETQNTVSLIQTSGEALNKIQGILQRGKKLAIQASQENATPDDKKVIQNKVTLLNQEIDSVSKNIPQSQIKTSPNLAILSQSDTDIIHCLKTDWLESAEDVVAKRYGLTADGTDLGIILDEDNPPYMAAIDYSNDPSGKSDTMLLHINAKTAAPAMLPYGGHYPQYDDRVITHEMVHAIMGRTMNYASLPIWFKEGTAEFITGADERIESDLSRNGGGMSRMITVQNALGDGTDNTWVNDSTHYSVATIAVRYLHDNIKTNGHSGGIKDLLTDLRMNPTEDLDQALSHTSSYKSVNDFVNDFVKKGSGSAYINKLDQANKFYNSDTGAIGGSDVDGGPVMTAETVVPYINHYTDTPLKHFKIEWPTQEGQASDTNKLTFIPAPFDSKSLGTKAVDVTKNPQGAITDFSNALISVSKERARLTTIQKQLGLSLSAKQTSVNKTSVNDYKININLPSQSSEFIMAQADKQPQRILQLLIN
jgi:flagellin